MRFGVLRLVGVAGMLSGVGLSCAQERSEVPAAVVMEREGVAVSEDGSSRGGTPPEVEVITLGAGCFWCTEAAYQLIDGVTDVQVGYMGGATVDPTYKQVCSGRTGHAEVAQITFDPSRTRLDAVLDVFWVVHNPTTPNRQGADVGSQYRSAIFYHAESQKPVIQTSLKKAQKALSGKIVTEIAPAVRFYAAENYHQDYYSNNPDAGYCRAVIAPKLKKVKKRIGK